MRLRGVDHDVGRVLLGHDMRPVFDPVGVTDPMIQEKKASN